MIIGLAGYAGAGKDTAGDILIQKHDYMRVAFADKIRAFIYDINPQVGSLTLREIVAKDGWDVAKQIPEVRRLLQDTGIAGRNLLGEDIWIWESLGTVVYSEANLDASGGTTGAISQKVVVTDVRFENEARFIRDFGGQVWQVVREGVKPINDHISETDLIGYDFDRTLTNTTKEELERQIDEALASLS